MKINYDPMDPAQVDDHDPVLARLRREARFEDVGELIQQMGRDVESTRELLGSWVE